MTDRPDPLAAKLAGLAPARPGLNRDRVMFDAGRASARPNRWWKVACLTLAVGQATAGLLLLRRNDRPAAPPVPPAPAAEPASRVEPPASGTWGWLRTHGDEMPASSPAEVGPPAGPPLTAAAFGSLSIDGF